MSHCIRDFFVNDYQSKFPALNLADALQLYVFIKQRDIPRRIRKLAAFRVVSRSKICVSHAFCASRQHVSINKFVSREDNRVIDANYEERANIFD